ncbi:hypothetical protein BBOV_III011380 [Babesia bovis T2Bo]|uniref:Uncharacterized protein n=1 Tax=Babesia bovis TaxID=5865 RepID=A7AQ56_BABBO|nr:hypothetical protein BBOV_III011380 [Babesia bovis T2Bo]EDO08690.1 hypothetical protein BBOV_III011380 [Babesia bovis T2Bo]|eukprot:XP_001612258.1 hypothetical protein [Babesia bovis T2Bo]
MAFSSMLTNVYILLLCFYKIYSGVHCRVLDFGSDASEDEISRYSGTFNNGGIYHLLYTKSDTITRVKYGIFEMDVPKFSSGMTDIFVELMSRGTITMFVSVTFVGANISEEHERVYMELSINGVRSVSKLAKDFFVDGFISLKLDLSTADTHPLIHRKMATRDNKDYNWYYLGNRAEDSEEHALSRLWFDEKYIISPVTNIESSSSIVYVPPNSLYGHITGFMYVFDEDYIVITVSDTGDREYILNLPPGNHDFLIPINMLHSYPKYHKLLPSPAARRPIHIDIDVARFSPQNPNVVTLTNCRRLQWYYNQYTILPINNVENISVRVFDAFLMAEIYTVKEHEFVTFIELFVHSTNNESFVIVHTRDLEEPLSADKHWVFKRHTSGHQARYVEQIGVNYERSLRRIYKWWPQVPTWAYNRRC